MNKTNVCNDDDGKDDKIKMTCWKKRTRRTKTKLEKGQQTCLPVFVLA